MSEALQFVIGLVFGVLASLPVALVIAVAVRQPKDSCDFTGWTPPDEISEEPAVKLYFDGIGREVLP